MGRAIGKRVRASVAVVHGGVPEGPQKRLFEYPVDVLVATPGRLLQLLNKGAVYLGDVRQASEWGSVAVDCEYGWPMYETTHESRS